MKEAQAEGQSVDTVILTKGYAEKTDGSLSAAVILEERLFEQLAQTETSQGLIAIVSKNEVSQTEFYKHVAASKGNVVVLDRLQDPGNIGTIIRTADAAGYCGIVTIAGTGDIFSPKIVRAAAGSLFRVPILTGQNTQETAEGLKAAGKTLISTCFDTDTYYYDVQMKQDTAIVIGNEGKGISDEFLAQSDLKVKIPMEGNIDSLNASVAAGILMYESMRK